jgi:hypothetical protein
VTTRDFPFAPRSTASLEVGDLIGVPCEPSGWACLQVTDLKRSGSGSKTTFVAGVLPWRGADPPTSDSTAGLTALEQALVAVELFTEGGLEVHDSGEVLDGGLDSNFRDMRVGAKHHVWGWRSAIRHAQAATQ